MIKIKTTGKHSPKGSATGGSVATPRYCDQQSNPFILLAATCFVGSILSGVKIKATGKQQRPGEKNSVKIKNTGKPEIVM